MTTTRLRGVFAALALALALPGALLVRRALASVALEREARERAVAERAFDEMERALTELLRVEEARPASDYDFASEVSALREKPEGVLALGWFQIEADGRVTAPNWARSAVALGEEIAADGARFEAAGRPRAHASRVPSSARRSPDAFRGDAKVERPSAEKADAVISAAAPAEPASAPVRSDDVAPQVPEFSIEESVKPSEAANDAYGALAKLNTGAKEREQRKQRVYVEQQELAAEPEERAPTEAAAASETRARSQELVADAIAAAPSASSTNSTSEWSDVREESPQAGAGVQTARASEADSAALGAASALAPSPLRDETTPSAASTESQRESSPASARADLASAPERHPSEPIQPSSELVRVVVDPMRGRFAKSGELLLVRSAWIGDRGVRQGVVFSVPALERTLAAAALGDGALPGAVVRIALPIAPPSDVAASSERHAFAHRFGEPFEALTAELLITPFADEGARSVHWLAALFALAGAGGLFAVYRMTAVALHFAERRSNFAAAVSHELKTPLTAIRLYAEMLRDGLVSGDEKRREYYGSITAETERLSRLINNVLEFSKLEKGVRSVAPRIGDAAPVVREAAELLRAHAAEHGLELVLRVDDALPPVRFERDALLQIVFNLVDNAVKYGRGEPATIEIACRRAGDGVAIVVRDHGPGVPREELSRILEPFYRRGDELTRSAPGAGIGLALVRSLAGQMGAALEVANAEGGGLAVSLALSRT